VRLVGYLKRNLWTIQMLRYVGANFKHPEECESTELVSKHNLLLTYLLSYLLTYLHHEAEFS